MINNILKNDELILSDNEKLELNIPLNTQPKAQKVTKEEVKTFFSYRVAKDSKIEFLASKKALETLVHKHAILVSIEYSLKDKLKVKKLLAYKMQTVLNSDDSVDHTLLYLVDENSYLIVPANSENTDKDQLNFYLPADSKVNSFKIEVLKCKASNDLSVYNEIFNKKNKKDSK